jgi:hypothetical protein
MTRISKQGRKRSISPRRPKAPSKKTGPLKDKLELGYRPHENAVVAASTPTRFIPKIG